MRGTGEVSVQTSTLVVILVALVAVLQPSPPLCIVDIVFLAPWIRDLVMVM
jgi:hypothetical protein